MDGIGQWISDSIADETELRSISELLKTVADPRLQITEFLVLLIENTLTRFSELRYSPSKLSGAELPITTQLAIELSHMLRNS